MKRIKEIGLSSLNSSTQKNIANIVHSQGLNGEIFISKQWNKYEQMNCPFMDKIQEATMKNHSWSQQQRGDYVEMVYSHSSEYLANSL